MERRTSERLWSVGDVTILYRNLGLVPGSLINISLGGMCIDTGSVNLPVNASVSVSFNVETSNDHFACEAHAIVVRNNDQSCCLMFDGMSEETHQALRSLVGDWQLLPETSASNQMAIL